MTSRPARLRVDHKRNEHLKFADCVKFVKNKRNTKLYETVGMFHEGTVRTLHSDFQKEI